MQGKALLLATMVLSLSLSGCFGEDEVVSPPVIEVEDNPRIFVTDKTGADVDIEPLNMTSSSATLGKLGKNPASASPQQDASSSSPWRRSCGRAMED